MQPIPTPSAERYPPHEGTFDRKPIEHAYELGFALMYEDLEGPAVNPSSKWESCMGHLHEFMDAYQCYPSKQMCWRLEALISRDDDDRRVNEHPSHYLRIAKELHSPRIWMEALKGAALQHYQCIGRPDHASEGLSRRSAAAEEQDAVPEGLMRIGCGDEILEIVRSLAEKIATHYEPVRISLTTLKLDSILREKQGLRSYFNMDPSVETANSIFRQWQMYPMAEYSVFGQMDYHIFWKLFTGEHRVEDMINPLSHGFLVHNGPVSEILQVVLEKLRECVAPLYEGLWKSSARSDVMHRKRAIPNRKETEFDPVPCIRADLEREFRSQEALRLQN